MIFGITGQLQEKGESPLLNEWARTARVVGHRFDFRVNFALPS